jgi:hypothetical protein
MNASWWLNESYRRTYESAWDSATIYSEFPEKKAEVLEQPHCGKNWSELAPQIQAGMDGGRRKTKLTIEVARRRFDPT